MHATSDFSTWARRLSLLFQGFKALLLTDRVMSYRTLMWSAIDVPDEGS